MKEYIIQKLQSQNSELMKLGIRRIGLFGSHLHGHHSLNSDIDFLVEFDSEFETFDNLMALYDLLEMIFEGKKVDIVTKNGLSPYIGPYILDEVEYA